MFFLRETNLKDLFNSFFVLESTSYEGALNKRFCLQKNTIKFGLERASNSNFSLSSQKLSVVFWLCDCGRWIK